MKELSMRLVLVLVLVCFWGLSHQADGQSIDTLFIRAAHAKLLSAAEYTLKVADLMPADKYSYKPSSGEMSFAQQLAHLSRNLGWLSAHYIGNEEENPVSQRDLELRQKDSVIAVVKRSYNYALDKLEQFPPDRLRDTVSFFAGPLSKLQIINLIHDHQTHHRGQLIVYLRMNGIKPPAYVGW